MQQQMTFNSNNLLMMSSVREKIALLPRHIHELLLGISFNVPLQPGRDVKVCLPKELPPKPGLSTKAGVARLLHDLANIELQAMELGVRTLIEFPEAPRQFREELAEVTLEEAYHLELCLDGIAAMGFAWGDWPVHLGLWQCVRSEDDFLDRITIVHRYLEGSGLDAGQIIRRRLTGVSHSSVHNIIEIINHDEINHVFFGTFWFNQECKKLNADPEEEFARRLKELFPRLPRRLEPIDQQKRIEAGFSLKDILTLEQVRLKFTTD